MLVVLGLGILALLIWMYIRKKTVADVWAILKKIGWRMAEGVGAIRHLKKKWSFIFLTIALWTLYFLGGYIGFMAFRETEIYGIREAFTILSAGSIGMVASPGGIGAYAFLIGWILWLATTAVIVFGGIISFVAIPFYNKKRNLETS